MDTENNEFNSMLQNSNYFSIKATETINENREWCISIDILMNGFTCCLFSDVIGSGKIGETKAKRLASVINQYNDNYELMKNALSFCLPDMSDVDEKNLTDEQLFTLNKVKEILNEN